MSKQVAETILAQMGGNRALVMMGAKGLAYGEAREGEHLGYLRWQMGAGVRNAKGKLVTHVTVTLCLDDTYRVESYSIRGLKCTALDCVDMVYVDALRPTIESVTGCYLSL